MIAALIFSTWCLNHVPVVASTPLVRCELERDARHERTARVRHYRRTR